MNKIILLIKSYLKNIRFIYVIYRKYYFRFFFNKEKDLNFLKKNKFNYTVDIGANVGTYMVQLQYISQKVFCFEPIRVNHKYLNWLKKSNVTLFLTALGDRKEQKIINIPKDSINNRNYALASLITKKKSNFYIQEKVNINTFDATMKPNVFKKIDFG